MEWTQYFKDYGDRGFLRIFKKGTDVLFVNSDYLLAVESYIDPIGSAQQFGMIVFEDINYKVLPVRISNFEDIFSIMEATPC